MAPRAVATISSEPTRSGLATLNPHKIEIAVTELQVLPTIDTGIGATNSKETTALGGTEQNTAKTGQLQSAAQQADLQSKNYGTPGDIKSMLNNNTSQMKVVSPDKR